MKITKNDTKNANACKLVNSNPNLENLLTLHKASLSSSADAANTADAANITDAIDASSNSHFLTVLKENKQK
eukprot:8934572-Ditylum_brightwellii.AAC.1